MSTALDSFLVLISSGHGTCVTRTYSSGNVTYDIQGIWEEDHIDREYSVHAERTARTGLLTVMSCDLPYDPNETWTINEEVWQVAKRPHTEKGLRLLSLRRDEKVRTASSRGHMI